MIDQQHWLTNPEVIKAIRSLSEYQALLVTGPQRSGTTIGARVLAQETGLEYIDEDDFGVHDCKLFEAILRQPGIVVQCPAMSRWIHHYATEQRCVVFMHRLAHEINASADRVGWNYAPELDKYKSIMLNGATMPMLNITRHNLATVTYMYWQSVQKPACPHSFDLHFDTLRGHPLFVQDHLRKEFTLRQWQRGEQ